MNTFPEAAPGRRRRRHSDEFKARVVEACHQPGVSMASVALANGLNANLLRRWVVERERACGKAAAMERAPARSPEPQFLPVRVAGQAGAQAQIRIALQGQGVSVKVRWPIAAADECARWLRAVLG